MHRALLLMLLLTVAVPPALALAPAAPPALPSFDTTRYYDKARFDAAIVPYTQAIARNSNDARAHYWLGVAYLHMAKFHRFGVAPFAAGFEDRAVASLEQSLRLRPAIEVMLALADAYGMVGARAKHNALLERVSALIQPLPIK
jgi:tetratricopeptide (TPR) repeat protein